MSDVVRVLRILEYVGDREWVENTLQKGNVPADGIHDLGNGNKIKSCLIDKFPERIGKEK
jgi:hypothetical protein